MGSNFISPAVAINIVKEIGHEVLSIKKEDSDEILQVSAQSKNEQKGNFSIRILSSELREGMVGILMILNLRKTFFLLIFFN